METIENSFVFTEEGRKSLVSQEGGIRFAVIGGLLVQGLEIEDPSKLTYKELVSNSAVILGLSGISYKYVSGTEQVTISDESVEDYTNALENIDSYVFPTVYVPARQVISDTGSTYGSYEFDFNNTSLACSIPSGSHVTFNHFVLIGKQYAETDDATFNVDKLQEPVIVGVASIDNGIQFFGNESEYIAFKLKLLFTLTDEDNDATSMLCSNQELLEASKKLDIVNDGLKTRGVNIVDTDEYSDTINQLGLNDNGSFTTRMSMMVADQFNAAELENNMNAGGLMHLVNRKNDDSSYKKQLIFTTVEEPSTDTPDEPITGYYAGISLNGLGNNDESPVFKINAIDETDTYAVDIFGIENKFNGGRGNGTKSIFSTGNITDKPQDITNNGSDIFIASNNNTIMSANAGNILIKSNNNQITSANNNILIGGAANSLSDNGIYDNIFIGTENMQFSPTRGQTSYAFNNIIIGGNGVLFGSSRAADSEVSGTTIFNGKGITTYRSDSYIFGQYNKPSSTAKLVYGYGTDSTHRRNALEFYPEDGELKLYKTNGDLSIKLGGDDGIAVDQLIFSATDDYSTTINGNGIIATATNLNIDAVINPGHIFARSGTDFCEIYHDNICFTKDTSQGIRQYKIYPSTTALVLSSNNSNYNNIIANTFYGNLMGGDVHADRIDTSFISATDIKVANSVSAISANTNELSSTKISADIVSANYIYGAGSISGSYIKTRDIYCSNAISANTVVHNFTDDAIKSFTATTTAVDVTAAYGTSIPVNGGVLKLSVNNLSINDAQIIRFNMNDLTATSDVEFIIDFQRSSNSVALQDALGYLNVYGICIQAPNTIRRYQYKNNAWSVIY